jgi:hypothetical protein
MGEWFLARSAEYEQEMGMFLRSLEGLLALSKVNTRDPYLDTLIIFHDGTTEATVHSRILTEALKNLVS